MKWNVLNNNCGKLFKFVNLFKYYDNNSRDKNSQKTTKHQIKKTGPKTEKSDYENGGPVSDWHSELWYLKLMEWQMQPIVSPCLHPVQAQSVTFIPIHSNHSRRVFYNFIILLDDENDIIVGFVQ